MTFSKITESLCLALQYGCDRVEGVATLELHGEGMFGQCDARHFLISLHGRLEKRVKTCGSCLLSHIKSRDKMGALEGGLIRCEVITRRQDLMARPRAG